MRGEVDDFVSGSKRFKGAFVCLRAGEDLAALLAEDAHEISDFDFGFWKGRER